MLQDFPTIERYKPTTKAKQYVETSEVFKDRTKLSQCFRINRVKMSAEGPSRLFVRATNTDLTGRATPEPPSGTGATTVAFYSPTRSGTRPYIRDLDFWRLDHPVAAEANEAIWKKIEAVEGWCAIWLNGKDI